MRRHLAAAYLTVLITATGGINLLWTSHIVRMTQASQQRQGQLVERKLCTTLNKLAVLTPPPGNPASNPSRAYLQGLHATLAELGTDLGCRR